MDSGPWFGLRLFGRRDQSHHSQPPVVAAFHWTGHSPSPTIRIGTTLEPVCNKYQAANKQGSAKQQNIKHWEPQTQLSTKLALYHRRPSALGLISIEIVSCKWCKKIVFLRDFLNEMSIRLDLKIGVSRLCNGILVKFLSLDHLYFLIWYLSSHFRDQL